MSYVHVLVVAETMEPERIGKPGDIVSVREGHVEFGRKETLANGYWRVTVTKSEKKQVEQLIDPKKPIGSSKYEPIYTRFPARPDDRQRKMLAFAAYRLNPDKLPPQLAARLRSAGAVELKRAEFKAAVEVV